MIDIQHVLSLEGASIKGAGSYEELMDQASAKESGRSLVGDDDAYCILYTSGPSPPANPMEYDQHRDLVGLK